MRILKFILLFALSVGCSDNQFFNPSEEIEFGARYSIITTSNVPTINDGTLISKVSYSGCNDGHEFELRNHMANSTAELWLFKQTDDQPCDAYIEEEKTYNLTESILNSENIVLITPSEEKVSLK